DKTTAQRSMTDFERGCGSAVPRATPEGATRMLAPSANGGGRLTSSLTKADANDPVSRHVHQDFARILVNHTVGEALDSLRRHPPQGRILYLYVMDDQGHLEGVVPTRRLLLAAPEQAIAELMVRNVVALPARTTVPEACEFFIQYRFLAFPVVDEGRRLLGVVDVELYTDEVTQLDDGRVRDDLFQLLGVSANGARDSSPLGAFRRRFP